MLLIVYIALFIILSPRYFFSLAKTGNRITYKEVISHAAVFGFAVVIMQWVSKRYGVFEEFKNGETAPNAEIGIAPKAAPGGATTLTSPKVKPKKVTKGK
jgi:hypothetical protein